MSAVTWAPRLQDTGCTCWARKVGRKGPPPHLHSALQALEQPLLKGMGGSPQGLLQLSKAFWELGQKVSPGRGEGQEGAKWARGHGLAYSREGWVPPQLRSLRL